MEQQVSRSWPGWHFAAKKKPYKMVHKGAIDAQLGLAKSQSAC